MTIREALSVIDRNQEICIIYKGSILVSGSCSDLYNTKYYHRTISRIYFDKKGICNILLQEPRNVIKSSISMISFDSNKLTSIKEIREVFDDLFKELSDRGYNDNDFANIIMMGNAFKLNTDNNGELFSVKLGE